MTIEDEEIGLPKVYAWANVEKIPRKKLIVVINQAMEEIKRLNNQIEIEKGQTRHEKRWRDVYEAKYEKLKKSLVDKKLKAQWKDCLSKNQAEKKYCQWCKVYLQDKWEAKWEEENRTRHVIVDQCLREIDEELKGNPDDNPDNWVCKKETVREPRQAEEDAR